MSKMDSRYRRRGAIRVAEEMGMNKKKCDALAHALLEFILYEKLPDWDKQPQYICEVIQGAYRNTEYEGILGWEGRKRMLARVAGLQQHVKIYHRLSVIGIVINVELNELG